MTLDLYGKATGLIKEAHRQFGERLILTSHFNAESMFALHFVTQLFPDIQVLYLIDPHTHAFALRMRERFNLRMRVFQGSRDKLQSLLAACERIDGVAMVHGIRRYQTDVRSQKAAWELGTDGFYRIHPFLDFSAHEVADYIAMHDLPINEDVPRKDKKTECGIHCFIPHSP